MSQTVKLRRSATSGSVPTTSALALGELAINTYDGKLYLKKNVSGTETVVEIGANNLADTFNVYEYAVTSNTTVFSGADQNGTTLAYTTGSPPKVAVFLNGLLLDWGTDFTATNGTSVTLTSAAVSGDLVQIQAYKSEIYTGSNLTFPDNVKALFGNDSDLQIYHDGSHSYIRDVGTGNLHIDGTRVILRSASSANMVKAIGGGAVELYHNAIKKFETTSGGVTVSGALTIGTNDLITEESGQLKIQSGQGVVVNIDNNDSGPDLFRITKGSTGSNILQITTNDNSSTFSGKVSSTGFNLDDDYKAQFGTGNDLRLYHNGTTNNSNIENHTGGLFITNYTNDEDIVIRSDDGSGGVTPYMTFDGSDKNIDVHQHMRFVDSKNLQIGTGADLQLYHNGTNSYIRNYTGNLDIINEHNDGDIGFYSDNGSGGLNEYLRIDGGADRTVFSRSSRHSDNVVATFGTGEDLQIYHDGSHARLRNATGNFNIQANDFHITDGSNSSARFVVDHDGETRLFHNANLKLTTQSYGVDVTGELQSDSLDVDGNADISGNLVLGGNLTVNGTTTTLNTATLSVDDLNITIADGAANASAANGAGLTVDGANATLTYDSTQDRWNMNKGLELIGTPLVIGTGSTDVGRFENQSGAATLYAYTDRAIKFGNDTNGTHMHIAGDGDIGFGTSSPTADSIHLVKDNPVIRIQEGDVTNGYGEIRFNSTALRFRSRNNTAHGQIRFEGNNGTDTVEYARFKNNGNFGIGTVSPSAPLHITHETPSIKFTDSSSSANYSMTLDGVTVNNTNAGTNGSIAFHTHNGEKLRLGATDSYFSNTNVGIGTSSPDYRLDVTGPGGAYSAGDNIIGVLQSSTDHRTLLKVQNNNENDGASAPRAGIDLDVKNEATGNRMRSILDLRKRTNSNGGGDTNLSVPYDFHIFTNNFGTITGSSGQQASSSLTAGTVALTATKDQRVGINTSGPDYTLDVNGDMGVNEYIYHNNDTNTYMRFTDDAWLVRTGGDDRIVVSGGNVGIGNTDPKAKFQVEEYGIDTTETSTSATTQTVIHTMSASDFRSARFTIQVTNSTDSTYHTTEILMVHDGTNANITEFGKVFTANEEATFDADVSVGNVRLFATPATTDSMEFKVVCHSITV